MSLTTAAAAISMPRLRSIGFIPAATSLRPSLMIEVVSTVAVVVPSPALSLVFEATSRTIWAPIFSNLSSSSISLARRDPLGISHGSLRLDCDPPAGLAALDQAEFLEARRARKGGRPRLLERV